MREIREEEDVRTAVNQAELDWDRAFDSWEAVTWTAAHDPKAGAPLNEDGSIRALVFDGARSAKMPSVEIIYSFDDDQIRVLDARFYDAPHLYHGRA